MVEEEKVAEEGGEEGEGEEGQEPGGEAGEGATGGAEINRETTEVSAWVTRVRRKEGQEVGGGAVERLQRAESCARAKLCTSKGVA